MYAFILFLQSESTMALITPWKRVSYSVNYPPKGSRDPLRRRSTLQLLIAKNFSAKSLFSVMRLAPTVSFNVTISPTAKERWKKTRNAVKCTIGKTETEGLRKDGGGGRETSVQINYVVTYREWVGCVKSSSTKTTSWHNENQCSDSISFNRTSTSTFNFNLRDRSDAILPVSWVLTGCRIESGPSCWQ